MTVINLYKEETNIATSEDVFGISHPPELQCQNIDSVKETVNDTHSSINTIVERVNRGYEPNDLKDEIENLEYYNNLDQVADYLEDFRSAIEDARQWGKEWKNMFKSMIEANFSEDSDFCMVSRKTGKVISFEDLLEYISF